MRGPPNGPKAEEREEEMGKNLEAVMAYVLVDVLYFMLGACVLHFSPPGKIQHEFHPFLVLLCLKVTHMLEGWPALESWCVQGTDVFLNWLKD